MLRVWTDSISIMRISNLSRFRRYLLEKIEYWAPDQSSLISKCAIKLIKVSSLMGRRESKYLNHILTRLLPADPLPGGRVHLPTFLICAPKDLAILPYSIQSVIRYLSGDEKIWVLVPNSISKQVFEIIDHLQVKAEIVTDEELLGKFLFGEKFSLDSPVRMQLLKLLAVLSQSHKEILVVDSDTIFLKQRHWIQDKKIVFPISQEFLVRHANFNRIRLDLLSNSGLGYVTHHQVVCKNCLEEIILRVGGLLQLTYLMQSAYSKFGNWEFEYPSEWQFMGDFIFQSDTHEVVPVRFGNIGISRELIKLRVGKWLSGTEILNDIEELSAMQPDIYSISLHSYK